MRRSTSTDLGLVIGATILIGYILRIDLALVNTVPAGGDATAHVYWVSEMRELFGSGRVDGWSRGWFAGFPIGRFYYVFPAALIALLSLLVPYLVAFKVVMVLGALLLPAGVYVFLRGIGAMFPLPATGAAMSLLFLVVERSELPLGGTFASVLAGEFAFSLSLSLGLLGLGGVGSWLRGSGRWWSAVLGVLLTAACIASHVVVGIWVVLIGILLMVLVGSEIGRGWRLALWSLPILLTSFWWVPVLSELHMVTDPGFPSAGGPGALAGGRAPAVVLGAAGVILAMRRADGVHRVLLGWLFGAGVLVVVLPDGLVVSSARLLPFWDLAVVLLGAVALVWILESLPQAWRPQALTLSAGAVLAGALLMSGPVSGRAPSVFSGLEARESWAELEEVVSVLDELGGGRVAWEVFPGLSGYGSPFALQLLPYWTDNSVTTVDGLLRESSATSPAVERVLSEVSAVGRRSMSNVFYGSLDDFDQGVEHLQLLGVDWYLAASAAAKSRADANRNLELAVQLESPALGKVADWSIYRVAQDGLVVPLSEFPAVVESGGDWRENSDRWFVNNGWPARLLAASQFDPSTTPRFDRSGDLQIDNISSDDGSIEFSVSETNIPVLVKVSYAPGWIVEGGSQPIRVAPNLMAVTPSEQRVRISYMPTAADTIGLAITVLGTVGVGLSAWLMSRRPS